MQKSNVKNLALCMGKGNRGLIGCLENWFVEVLQFVTGSDLISVEKAYRLPTKKLNKELLAGGTLIYKLVNLSSKTKS